MSPFNRLFNRTAARLGLGDELGGVLARGVVASLLVRVAGMASSLLLYLVLARLLAPAGFGQYALALSWLSVLAIVATLGTDNAGMRFISEYRGNGDQLRARSYQRFAMRLSASVGIGLWFVASVAACWFVRGDAVDVFIIAFAAIPLVAQIAQRQAALRAYGAVISALLPEQVVRPLLIVGLVALCFVFAPPVAPRTAALCLLVGTLLSFVLGQWLLVVRRREADGETSGRIVNAGSNWFSADVRMWLGTALRLGVLSGSYTLLRQLDLMMVGSLSTVGDAGIFAVAKRCADIAVFVSLAIDAILAPMIARLHAQGDRTRLALLVRRAVRIAVVLSAPTCLLLWVLGRWVLGWFGPDYVAGYATLAMLTAAQLIAVVCGYGKYLLTMTGREGEALGALFAAIAVDVVANIALIPLWGNLGAAIATLLALTVWCLGCGALAWWRVGINPLPFGRLLR